MRTWPYPLESFVFTSSATDNPTVTTASLSRLILRNHTTGAKGFRRDYFDHLKSCTREFVDGIESGELAASLTADQAYESTPVQVLNRIFRMLEPYAIELNRVTAGSGFVITASPPAFSHERFEGQWPYNASKMVQVYRCRFASMVLSASIRVKDDTIGFYLLPAEHAIRQSEAEEEFGPLMIFSSYGDSGYSRFGDCGKALWWVEGKPLTDERFERYCLLFFDHFVKRSQRLVLERMKAEQF